jgi:hypothetical protein
MKENGVSGFQRKENFVNGVRLCSMMEELSFLSDCSLGRADEACVAVAKSHQKLYFYLLMFPTPITTRCIWSNINLD